jgi:hypothetical protein
MPNIGIGRRLFLSAYVTTALQGELVAFFTDQGSGFSPAFVSVETRAGINIFFKNNG